MGEGPAPTETPRGTVKEQLELALVSGGIKSLRTTPDEPSELVQLAEPSAAEIDNYRLAMAKTASLEQAPDPATRKYISDLIRPLRDRLAEAIPTQTRNRLFARGSGTTQKLAAIELMIEDPELEAYPWELIAEPSAFGMDAAEVTVYRRVVPDLVRPTPQRWTNHILLTGSEAMRRVPPFVHEELTWITNELTAHDLEVACYPDAQPNLEHLLVRHQPEAFHLVAHGTSTGIQFQAERGPTLSELRIDPIFIGRALGRSAVWVAMFNCCDSATTDLSRGKSPARRIAELSRAVTIGMAGRVQPFIGAMFARNFYRWLGDGYSVLQAYHEGIRSIRDHDTYSNMWSIPIMYATDAEIIPFPTSEKARIRLGLNQIRIHLMALDSELAELAALADGSPGEWSARTSTPVIRIECIETYLSAVAAAFARTIRPDRYRRRIERAQTELTSVLASTSKSLSSLSDAKGEPSQRREVIGKVPLHRLQQQRMIGQVEHLLRELNGNEARP